jgi:hypothetical protein
MIILIAKITAFHVNEGAGHQLQLFSHNQSASPFLPKR